LDVRETGETGRGGRGTATWRCGDNFYSFGCKRDRRDWKRRKRNSDMETWGQLHCFGCKRDRRDWKRREEGQRHGDVGTTTIALDVRETGETGRKGKRNSDMETWRLLQLLLIWRDGKWREDGQYGDVEKIRTPSEVRDTGD
jgi:hypothetical protein